MLKRFLAIEVDAQGRQIPQEQSTNRKLFVGGEVELDTGETRLLKPLKISKYAEPMQHQGEYPVISLDFKDVKGSSYQEIVEALKKKVTFLYREHAYLEQGIQDGESTRCLEDYDQQKLSKYLEGEFDGIDLKYGLYFLSELIHDHFRKPVYILIDEYDAPIAHAYLTWKDNAKDASRVFKLLESFLGPALKGNKYLKRGLLTGVFKICPTTIFSSGLNSICHYTLFNKTFSPFYGFTQSELDELLRKVPISASPSEIQRWYKGYTFGDQEVYNPWSIMCCLSNGGKLARYWFEREEAQLANLMPYSKINQYNLQKLVSGNRFSLPVPNRVDFEDILGFGGLYELLVFGGYLNAVPPIPGILHDYDISIPTYEMRHFYEQLLLSWVYEKLHTDESTYKKLAKLLSAGKVGTFTETMHEVLSQSSNLSSLDYWQAHTIHKGFMLGLLINLVGHYDLELETYQHNTLLIPTVDLGDQALV
ncbi:MAG: AAA family ATPase, partial [Bacteroidota bacterium]